MKRIYNLKNQTFDTRDFSHLKIINPHSEVILPKLVDLRSFCPPIFDQGELGSCTANAGIAAFMMLEKTPILFSRIFQYYEERKIEGDISEDGGAQIRDIGKVLFSYGTCIETCEPYIIENFAKTPSQMAISNAAKNKIKSYHSVTGGILGIKQIIALKSQPVLSGIIIYESFEEETVSTTGIIPLPKIGEQILGGHAILIVGYDDSKSWFICRNSWGDSWGDKGYFYLSYDFIKKGFASDFWVLQN